MKELRIPSSFFRISYLWVVLFGGILGLIIASMGAGRMELMLARGILGSIAHRMAVQTRKRPPRGKPVNLKRLSSLSLWGGVQNSSGERRERFPKEAGMVEASTKGPLVLKGIVRYPNGTFEAVFLDTRNKKTRVVKKGDRIDGLVVVEIRPERVIVGRNGERVAYPLFRERKKASKKAQKVEPLASKLAASTGRVVLTKREVQAALGDMASFLRQVRIVPYMEKGKPQGFQLFDIVPGSIVDRVGLKNGDVIERVNGKPIRTPEEALQLFTMLQSGQGLTLDLKRGYKHQSIAIELK